MCASGAAAIGGKAARPNDPPAWMAAPVMWLARAVLGLVALLAAGILATRWLPPPTSAFILEAQFHAWREGRAD